MTATVGNTPYGLLIRQVNIPANSDLDTLVQEAKRIRRGEGMTTENVQAFTLFFKAAVAGHAEAQFLVCQCYELGFGVEQDRAQYIEWLNKSSESGYPAAQNRRGYEAEDHVEQNKWFRAAAEQGNSKAQLNLGNSYRYGYGVAKDPVEAAKWYRKAAESGNSWAQRILGDLYSEGEGVKRDDERAVDWWRKAAEQEDARAEAKLGTCYAAGRGVPRDEAQAFLWWRRAANKGCRHVFYDLGICYARGVGAKKSHVEAYRWLRLAAENESNTLSRSKVLAEAAALEELMSSAEIHAGLALCTEFDETERSREPRWLAALFEGAAPARRPLNQMRDA